MQIVQFSQSSVAGTRAGLDTANGTRSVPATGSEGGAAAATEGWWANGTRSVPATGSEGGAAAAAEGWWANGTRSVPATGSRDFGAAGSED